MTSSPKSLTLEVPRACGIAYCAETRRLLSYGRNAIEYYDLSSSGLSLQSQKTLNWFKEWPSCLFPSCMRSALKMGAIFVGCYKNEGIRVFDGKNHQLLKKFAQNMDSDFDCIVVDEIEDPQSCTVYTSSIEENLLTKFDYNSGSVLSELSVEAPFHMVLKGDKLYLICAKESEECILVIDKHSLKIQSRFALSNWSQLGGLCLDESGNVCVTAFDKSNQRFIYSFDDGGNLVREVLLPNFRVDEEKAVYDMIVIDNDVIMLTLDIDTELWALHRIKLN